MLSPDLTEFDQFPAKPGFQVLVLRLLTMAFHAENAEITRAVIGAHPIDMMDMNADFREPLTLLISAHFRALSVPTFGVIVELRCINAGTNKSIHGGS